MKSAVIIFLVIAMSGIIHAKNLELDNDPMQPDMMQYDEAVDVLAREDDIDSANVSDIDRNYVCRTLEEAKFCYYTQPLLNFGKSEEFCKTKNGHLASINSQEEQDVVTALIRSYSGGSAYTWIGYIDNEATGLDWNWIDGMGGYTNWATNFPSYPGKYLCAYFDGPNAKWYNTYCTNMHSVLCRMYHSH